MATKRISALTAAGSAALTDQIPIEDASNATKKLTLTQVFALAAASNWSWAGTAAFGAAVTMATTLGVTGAATLASTLGVTGDTTLGNATVGGTLGVTGAATMSSTLAVNGGSVTLGHGTANIVNWGTAGAGAPTFTSRSAGTKAVLRQDLGASTVDYAIGYENSHLWFSCEAASAARGFKWYGGETELMRLQGDGKLTLSGALKLAAYTLAGLPSAASHQDVIVICSDHTGGRRPVYCDGADWRDITTGNVAA